MHRSFLLRFISFSVKVVPILTVETKGKMNDLIQILSTIRRPFQQEVRNGCRNDAVVNGMSAYVKSWVEKARQFSLNSLETQTFDKIASLFEEYERLSTKERLRTIGAATEQIDAIMPGSDAKPLTKGRSVRRPHTDSHETVKQLPLFQSTRPNASGHRKEPPNESKAPTVDTTPLSKKISSDRGTSHESCESLPLFDSIHEDLSACPKPTATDSQLPEQSDASPAQTELVTIGDNPAETDLQSLDFLATSLQYTKGIGPQRARKLITELEIRTIGQLLEYYPRDYINRANLRNIYDVGHSGEAETIQGKVVNQSQFTPSRRGSKTVGRIVIFDGTGVAVLVNFGRRVSYLKKLLTNDTCVVVSGKFFRRNNETQTTDYEFEVLEDEDEDLIHTGRIVPKYPLTGKLTQRMLRQWMKSVLNEYGDMSPEILPLDIRRRLQLIDRTTALKEVHYPRSNSYRQAARNRLAFDEFFLLELGLELKKQRWETVEKGIAFEVEGQLVDQFVASLPFSLTNAQKRVLENIKADMRSAHAMNRLLQGDVGSGKTIVAAMALISAIQNGYQGVLMVPTEILAEQHATNLSDLIRPIGLNLVLLKGDQSKSARDIALDKIADGSAHIIVGTHALIQDDVQFHQLGLVIIDEQHRFGVMQRAILRDKGVTPDVLVMTATPIPRTLALTVYGDLDISVIDEMPPGRKAITTKWVKEEKRGRLYADIEKAIQHGRQVYIVYPLVEESENLEEARAATEMAEDLRRNVFPQLRVGLLHGRMRSAEKQEVMVQFKTHLLDILVSTTVIEVGIDIPNASIMVIENAERFGLAQLHQLRGRVGRGSHKSVCYLLTAPKSKDAFRRMKVMTQTNDGFKIAEADLEIRGPGEFFGTRQSGLPDFRIANLIQDAALLDLAKAEARRVAESDPSLTQPEHQLLKRVLQTHWKQELELVSVG